MDLLQHIGEHYTDYIGAYGTYLVISTAVQSLPDPDDKSSKFYLWLYRFSHGLVANWSQVKGTITPKK